MYKMSHEKQENLTGLYMREAKATDAARLEGLLDKKWYDNKTDFKMIAKLSP